MAVPRSTVPPPPATVTVFELQQKDRRRPWVVRWRVVGRDRSRSFKTKAEATRFRARLVLAVEAGEVFDVESGLPSAWTETADEQAMHHWAKTWLADEWAEWAPRTRFSMVEGVARFLPLLVPPGAPAPPPDLRRHLVAWLPPDGVVSDERAELWLDRHVLTLGDLSPILLLRVDARLGRRDDGGLLAPATAARYRKIARACVRRAVDLGVLTTDPWPPASRSRSNRKSVRRKTKIHAHDLPNHLDMARVIEAMRSHQPSSAMYQVMTGVAYYAGLRPSEVVFLKPKALGLPAAGWGHIDVTVADVEFDVPGEPKTGPRRVPIPPVLVQMLRGWIELRGLGPDDLLFRTRSGLRPRQSNWSRCLKHGLVKAGVPDMRVYDCRHAAATAWLGAGVPVGEVARRLGHNVETLLSTYVGVLQGQEVLANDRLDAMFASPAL